ncbi:hypothetical protein [Streptomyces sp. NPDC051776]|uniref:hypothetical protein n=1 Tax=Streptomyces sp. NPDC051776 TaxID=3155414 RepID=UPI003433ED62
MVHKLRGLVAAAVITGTLTGLAACNDKDDSAGSKPSASTGASSTPSASSKDNGLEGSGDDGKEDTKPTGDTSLPAPDGDMMTISAVGEDDLGPVAVITGGQPGQGYLKTLKSAGFSVHRAKQDNEPIKNVYEAGKGDVRLTVEMGHAFFMGNVITVHVTGKNRDFTLPKPSPAQGLVAQGTYCLSSLMFNRRPGFLARDLHAWRSLGTCSPVSAVRASDDVINGRPAG